MRNQLLSVIPLLFLTAACQTHEPTLLRASSTPATPASTQPANGDWPNEYNPTPTTGEADSLSNVVQLTSGFAKAGEAYFSPDMQWIIFQAGKTKDDQYQMYVAKLKWEGGEIVGAEPPTQISPEPSRNTCGYFSPDGNSLIFGSTAGKEKPDEPTSGYQRAGGNYRWAFPSGMEIYRADGWRAAVEAAGPGGHIDLAKHALTNNNVYDAECAFSPDGKWICYTSMPNNNLDVYVMRADGTGSVRITTAPGYDGGPFFSPEGKRLVYRSDRVGNNLLQVFTCDLTFDASGNITGSRNERELTHDVNVNWGPYWHPDGHHLIYATSKHGHTNYELYLMRDDGTHKTRITFSPGADILPVFSPDGKYLMWTSKRAKDQTSQVFVAKFRFPRGS